MQANISSRVTSLGTSDALPISNSRNLTIKDPLKDLKVKAVPSLATSLHVGIAVSLGGLNLRGKQSTLSLRETLTTQHNTTH